MKSIPENKIQLISKEKIHFAGKQPYLILPVLVFSLLYILYIFDKLKNKLSDTLLKPLSMNILIFMLFIIFTALIIGATLIGNELGKKLGTSIADPNKKLLKIGFILVIIGFISSYFLNSILLIKNQDLEQFVTFRQLVFPELFHWLVLVLIFYSGISIALTYFNLIIDKDKEIITLFRKLKLTEKPHFFSTTFDSFDGFIIAGSGNQPVTKARILYLHMFTSNNEDIQRVMIGKRDYLIGYDHQNIIKIIFDLQKLHKFKWMIIIDEGYQELNKSFFDNSNEFTFLIDVKNLIK
jgi:hypothetical protein